MTTIYLVFACWAALGVCNPYEPAEYGPYTDRAECERSAARYDHAINNGTGHPGIEFKCLSKRVETWR